MTNGDEQKSKTTPQLVYRSFSVFGWFLCYSNFVADSAVGHLAVDVRLGRLRSHPRRLRLLRHRLAHHQRRYYIQVTVSSLNVSPFGYLLTIADITCVDVNEKHLKPATSFAVPPRRSCCGGRS